MPGPVDDPLQIPPVKDFASDGCALGGCLAPLLVLVVVLTSYGLHVLAQENTWVWTAAYGLPIILMGVLYLRTRRRRPRFARGIGISALVMIVIFLGALATCIPHPYG